MKHVLYYSDNRNKGKIWYARRAPGDGGVDWEITDKPELAGAFGLRHMQSWVKLHGPKSGWRPVAEQQQSEISLPQCAKCGRPKATRDTPLHNHEACWATPAATLLPALDCSGREISKLEARALAAEAERDALRAQVEELKAQLAKRG